jgi:hypothetical protein
MASGWRRRPYHGAMKLTDWETRFPEPELAYVQERLTALDAVEVAALYLRDENGELRALVATNVALVDCGYVMDSQGMKFEVRVTPWYAAPIPWIAFAGFVSPAGMDGRYLATVRVELDPPFHGSYPKAEELQGATEFIAAAIRLRRPA